MIPANHDLPPLNEGHAALVRLITRGTDSLPVQCEPFAGAAKDDPGCKWAPPPAKPLLWRWWDATVWSLGLVRRPQ